VYLAHDRSRRRFIGGLCGVLGTGALAPVRARADQVPCELRFYHTHTGERLSIVYRSANGYVTEALDELTRFLADFRTGESKPIDPGLFDMLHAMQQLTGGNGVYEIISGYRSPATNAQLRTHSSGVAERSLHMYGKALDVRLTGVELAKLRDAAWALQLGGVGYYPGLDFVHVDTGRVRRW
jgi:uncharacterized protein YcbK (DUF882 family)